MSGGDEDLKALGQRARERDAEREAWERGQGAGQEDLLAPFSADEMARLRGAVRDVQAPPKPNRTWAWGGLVAAAAAVLLVVLIPRPGPELPPYGLELRSQGYAEVRSATVADAWTYARGMRFELVLRPATAVTEGLGAAAFVRTDDGVRRLDWTPNISTAGTARFIAEIGEGLSPGPNRVVFVVGPEAAVDRWRPGAEGVQAFERTLVLRVEETTP